MLPEFEPTFSFDELEKRFLAPYRKGRSIVINGKTITEDNLDRIRIFKTGDKIGDSLDHASWYKLPEVTKEMIAVPFGSESEADPHPTQELRPATNAREVFVVHGRNLAARDALFNFLRTIGLHPLEWSEAVQATGGTSPYIGDILDAAFSKAHAVVVLLTPDDEAQLREPLRRDNDPPYEVELSGQARPNVLFEAGMAMGRNEDRTVLVELGTLRPFSDVAGRHAIRFGDNSQCRQELAKRLETAGCPVNLNGNDWHTAGDFKAALELTVQISSESAVAVEQQSTIAETPLLSEEAKRLLIEAVKDKSGLIQKIPLAKGPQIKTNGKTLNELGIPRSDVKWEEAIDDLIDRGLVKDDSSQGKIKVFKVTDKGFKVADNLEKP